MTIGFLTWCNKEVISLRKIIEYSNGKKWCAENALFIVDSIAMFIGRGVEKEYYLFGVNINKPINKILIRTNDNTIIKTSMSLYSMNKFNDIYHINKQFFINEAKEAFEHA